MNRLGERLICCAPLLLVLASACGSSETTTLGTTLLDSGVVVTTVDAGVTVVTPVATTVAVSIPAGAVGRGPAAYGVNPLTVAVGTTVTWTNNDSIAHTATSDTGVWDSGILSPAQSFSFTFAQAGTYPYHCAIHGVASMSGTIVVQ